MGLGRAWALAGEIHVLESVAIAAFTRIVGLHARPFMLSKLQPVRLELLPRVDGAENLAPHLLRGLDLAGDLERPVVRHVAVRAGRSHTAAICKVNGGLDFLVD